MTDPAANPVDARPAPRPWWRSVPARTALVTVKLLCVYALSLKDAAFFYQQF